MDVNAGIHLYRRINYKNIVSLLAKRCVINIRVTIETFQGLKKSIFKLLEYRVKGY